MTLSCGKKFNEITTDFSLDHHLILQQINLHIFSTAWSPWLLVISSATLQTPIVKPHCSFVVTGGEFSVIRNKIYIKYPVYSIPYTELYIWDENHVTEGPAIHQPAPCHYFLDGDIRNYDWSHIFSTVPDFSCSSQVSPSLCTEPLSVTESFVKIWGSYSIFSEDSCLLGCDTVSRKWFPQNTGNHSANDTRCEFPPVFNYLLTNNTLFTCNEIKICI